MRGSAALELPAERAAPREGCPVAHVTPPGGDPATLLTRYEDVRRPLSDDRFGSMPAAEGAACVGDDETDGVSAFGAGSRSGLGQSPARTELRTALHVPLRRLPSLELAAPAADPRRLEGLAVGGLSEVPVRW
jgi:cytochrome P450